VERASHESLVANPRHAGWVVRAIAKVLESTHTGARLAGK
jgi:hypothetical protein